MTSEYCRNFPFCTNSVTVAPGAPDTPFCSTCEQEEGGSLNRYVATIAGVEAERKLHAHRMRAKQRNYEELNP